MLSDIIQEYFNMITAENIIRSLSDIIMAFSSAALISSFGISKIESHKRVFAALAAALLPAVIFTAARGLSSVVGYSLIFMTVFIIIFKKIKLSHIYIALMSESIIELVTTCLCSLIYGPSPMVYPYLKNITLLTVRIVFLIASLLVERSQRVNRIQFIIKIVPKHIFILTAMSVEFITLLAENISYTLDNTRGLTVSVAIIFALTVSLVIIIFSLLINVVAKKQFSDSNELLRHQVDTQLRHYRKLEKLSNDIRSFRHDYINHMRSILSLLETEQYEDAREYVEKLDAASPERDYSFQTGNLLADAILTDKSDICGENVKIVFYGFIPDRIDNADLCVILSNALDNAAEACAELCVQCSVEVYAQERQGYFVLTVKNPTADGRTYHSIPETKKSDALNHGYGLRNIEAVVKKYGGLLSVKCEDMVFELSLTFKI